MTVEYRSEQEATLRKLYPAVPYEKGSFDYTTSHRYVPDFHLGGNIYVECKEYIAYIDVTKYEAIAASNPSLDLRFLVGKLDRRTLDRLERTFQVSVSKYIIPPQWIIDGEKQNARPQ